MFDESGWSASRYCGKLLSLAVAVFAIAAPALAQTGPERARAVSPEALSAIFAEIIRAVRPSVVTIDTRTRAPEVSVRPGSDDQSSSIDEMMRRPPRGQSNIGSGFIVDRSGYIVTNSHVIEDAAKIYVQLDGGDEFVAKVIGIDDETDIAVIKIEAGRELPVARIGDSGAARVGDWVLAFGAPFGLARSVTSGIISALDRETPASSLKPFQRFIQTDAAINRGNSGGPLVDMNGAVIGVNSQIATTTGDSNGIAFALPSNDAVRIYREIIANGGVRRGYLGVNLESVKTEMAAVYGLGAARGAIITRISDKNSAAAAAGLRTGDLVLEIDGRAVENATDLIVRIAAMEPEKTVQLLIVRDTGAALERRTLPVKLGERPAISKNQPTNPDRRTLPLDGAPPANILGLTVAEIPATTISALKIEGQRGVVVRLIDPRGPLADLRDATGDDALSVGDIIVRINRAPVGDPQAFAAAAAKLRKGDAVVLEVLSPNLQRLTNLKFVQFTIR